MLRRGVVLHSAGRGGGSPWQQIMNKFSKKAMNQATAQAKQYAKTANAQQVVQSVARTAAAAEQAARAKLTQVYEQFNQKQQATTNNTNTNSHNSSGSSASSGGESKAKDSSPFAPFWEFIRSLSTRLGPQLWKVVESLGVTMTFSLIYYLYSTSNGLMNALHSYKENLKRIAMRESYQQELRETVEDAADDVYGAQNSHSFVGDASGKTAAADTGSSHGLQRPKGASNDDEEKIRQRLQRRDERRMKRTAEEDGVSYYDEANAQRLEQEQLQRQTNPRMETTQQQKSRTELLATSLLREAEEEGIRQQLDATNQQTYYNPASAAKAKIEDGNRRRDNRSAMNQARIQLEKRQKALVAKRKTLDVETTAGMPQEEYDQVFINSFYYRMGSAASDPNSTPAAGHNMKTAARDRTLIAFGSDPTRGQLPESTRNFNEYTNGGVRTAEVVGTAASVHSPSGRYLSGAVVALKIRMLRKVDSCVGTNLAERKLEALNRSAPDGFVMDPLSGRLSRIETIENTSGESGQNRDETPSFDFRHAASM